MNFSSEKIGFWKKSPHILKYNFFVFKYFFKIFDSAESWDHVLQKRFRFWRILSKLDRWKFHSKKYFTFFSGFWLPTWDPATIVAGSQVGMEYTRIPRKKGKMFFAVKFSPTWLAQNPSTPKCFLKHMISTFRRSKNFGKIFKNKKVVFQNVLCIFSKNSFFGGKFHFVKDLIKPLLNSLVRICSNP